MPNPDLSKLTPAQVADYHRRKQANCQLYGMTVEEAETKGNGVIGRIASNIALKDVRNRRAVPGRTR